MISLRNNPVIYVTRDLERALGLPLNTKGYFIISNFTPFAKSVAKNNQNILLIKNSEKLDTWELLQLLAHPERSEGSFEVYIGGKKIKSSKFKNEWFKRFLAVASDATPRSIQVLVFKNTLQIEKTCTENGWKLLNPPAKISNEVEEKISQIYWLGPLKKYLPIYSILKCKDVKFNNKPFILQFNRSHTGSGTILMESKKQLQELQKKFPEREVRTAEYISGPLFTNNNVVTNDKILLGNINYQITGLKPFTDLPFSTIGNDWALPHKILTKKQIIQYHKIATDVGLRLKKAGWRGLYGIDIVLHEHNEKLYLLEINCRQPASTTYESQLQSKIKSTKSKITTFEGHLMSLLNDDLQNKKLIEIKDGAQVIQRVLSQKSIKSTKSRVIKLKNEKFNVILYNNSEPNSDLIRIQSKTGIMKKHNEFNETGNKILSLMS